MRCLLFLLTFSFAAGLSAQVRTDTIYDASGVLNQIRYSSSMDVDQMSKADRFMRGIRAGETVFQLDSIQLFKEGESMTVTGETMKGIPRPGRLRAAYTDPAAAEGMKEAKANDRYIRTDYVEGRAGMRVRRTVLPVATGKSVKHLERLDDSPEIELIENPTGEDGDVKAKIYIPAGAVQRKLVLDFGDGKQWEKLYTIRGYHLNETDFKRENELSEAQTWRAEGRDYLYLRLRSTEKLLYISQGETRYQPVPVGRQLDEVYLKGLATGKYLLEIIDLGTKQKRYHWLEV